MGASDLLGKVAAALASSSIVWKDINPSFSSDLLSHAKDLWSWGDGKKGECLCSAPATPLQKKKKKERERELT